MQCDEQQVALRSFRTLLMGDVQQRVQPLEGLRLIRPRSEQMSEDSVSHLLMRQVERLFGELDGYLFAAGFSQPAFQDGDELLAQDGVVQQHGCIRHTGLVDLSEGDAERIVTKTFRVH